MTGQRQHEQVLDAQRRRPAIVPDLRSAAPLCIRITTDGLLDLAEEADIRAHIIERLIARVPTTAEAASKVTRLRAAASDLRGIADRLMVGWD